jgi:SAM-dependent methyltransferase
MNNFKFVEITCPVCSSDKSKFLGWRGGEAHQRGAGVKTSIVRCQSCSHQYPNPMPYPEGDLGEIYVDAEEYFRGHDVEKKKQNGLQLMREFERRLGKKGRFLDVGCGAGELLWAAKESGWEAVGIDPSPEFIEIGRTKLGVEGRVSTLEDANFPDGHFDAVIMSGIVEHLYNPLETLKEVHRVLRDDGWFWFDAPNEDGLYMTLGNLYMRTRGKDWLVVLAPTFPPYHVQGFNPKSLRMLVEKAGFSTEKMELFGDVSSQTGESTLRKKIENNAAIFLNWFGRTIGKGMYMSLWARKK